VPPRQVLRGRQPDRRRRDRLGNLFDGGGFDLLVKFYVEADTDIGHFVNEQVQKFPGIRDTRTIITFKAF
jgi:DNA-binding Lrp family transcriptional regulator